VELRKRKRCLSIKSKIIALNILLIILLLIFFFLSLRKLATPRLTYVSLVLVVGLTGVLFFHFFTLILNPLRELIKATNGLKKGDMDQSIKIRRNDEMGDLMSIFNENIKDLRESQQLLITERNRLQAIMDSAGVGIFILNMEGKILFCNPNFGEITGWSLKDIKGKKWEEVISTAANPQKITAPRTYDILETTRQGKTRTGQLIFNRQDEEVVIKYIYTPYRDRENKVVGSVGVFSDMTREITLERMKSDFVSNITHELRTPLAAIKGATDLVLGGLEGPVNPGQKRFLKIIKGNTERFIKLINNLLDISKIEAGKVKMNLAKQSILPVISEVLDSLKPLVDEKKIILETKIPERTGTIKFDRDRISQVLVNLVSNAIKFTPKGGRIRVEVQEFFDRVDVNVSDTGIGIAPENLSRVFDRFYQVDSSTTKTALGTGLGLVICKDIINAHRGEIWVVSEIGKGSKFTFSLYKEGARGEKPVGRHLTPKAKSRKKPFVVKKVLIVEDDANLSEVMKTYLESKNYEVIIASTGNDALELTKREQPDVISLDVLLPDMNGFKILKTIKNYETTKDIPVIMVSVTEDENKVKGMNLGVFKFLPKPFQMEQLFSTIKEIERILNKESGEENGKKENFGSG